MVPRKRPCLNCLKSFKVVLTKRTEAPSIQAVNYSMQFGSLDMN